MAIPSLCQHTGSLSGSPVAGSIGSPSLQEISNTSFQVTTGSSKSARPSIINATYLSPFVLSLDTITKVQVLYVRVRSGSIKMLLTSAAGTDQAFRVSDMFMINPIASGDEITAIKFVGTADIEVFLAGSTL